MEIQAVKASAIEVPADLLVVLTGTADAASPTLVEVSKACGHDLLALAEEEGFESGVGEKFLMRGLSGLESSRVLLVGVGSSDTLREGSARRAAVIGARVARSVRARRVAVVAPQARAGEVVEGFLMGAYRFDRHRTRREDSYEGVEYLSVVTQEDVDAEMDFARTLADAVLFARDLVNETPNHLTPEAMAQAAKDVASDVDLECTILDENELHERGFNLITAVGKGSTAPPRLIHLVYRPQGEVRQRIAFVGKGVTFDTGGYNLKPGASMLQMHSDMGGGAAVLGAAKAIGALSPQGLEVHFVVPAAENNISGGAMKPQDIFRGYGGKTVEIHNTDAEGRLLLADALAYIQEQGVDTIVDLATLTGASVVALGPHIAALFTNDDGLASELLEASHAAGESYWRMPLSEKLDAMLDTPMADMKNVGQRWGGAITAALFLKRWVALDAWAHLDIAGPAYNEKDDDLAPQGGTGFGVATLVRFVTNRGATQ